MLEATSDNHTSLRPTHVDIDLSTLAENYRRIQAHVQRPVMPVIKANAYGHGLIAVAKLYQDLGVERLGVALLEEGIMLREAGIHLPILVLGGILGDQVPLFLRYQLTLSASSLIKLSQIEHCAKTLGVRAQVHLKIDTGMERIGIHYYNAQQLLTASLECKHIDIDGIFTHFSSADSADLSFARLQLERFAEVCDWYDRRSLPTPTRHAANSGAVAQLPEAWLDLVRPGILCFGVYPCTQTVRSIDLAPALALHSRVVFFKVIPADTPVSYGGTWRSQTQTRIVTIPCGYGDGYFRALSGNAEVLIRGRRYRVVGKICMDQCMVEIGMDNNAYNGDQVTLIGTQNDASISAEQLAQWANTIPYEILTNLNTRLPRRYLNDPFAAAPTY